MDKKNSWKQKSAALTLAVSMVIANPLALTGCSSSDASKINSSKNQSQNINKDKDKEDEDQQQNASGGSVGHASSPFIFNSSSGTKTGASTISNESSSGWHVWTTPSSSGGYSGIHASSAAS